MGLLLLAAVLLPFYLVGLGIYRLYFHPLAGVPGPKFAALTQWYESYFELFHKGLGGQYTFRIRQLHEEYGPIVRISPGEVHIDDPDFYSNIYTYKRGLDKPASLQWRFGAPSALFSTPRHDVHKMRRAAQDPFFSKRRIAQLAPQIQSKADKMCSRLARDFVGGDSGKKPVSLDNMFASYIADVTTQYSFDRDFDWLGHKDFESPFLKVIRGFKDIAHPCTQFPSLARVMTAVMKLMIKLAPPSMSLVLEFQEDMRKMVIGAQEDLKSREKGDLAGDETTDKTIVHGILKSGLPEEELDLDLLKDHAVSLIGAGIASAQWTLTVAFFHIIADRQVYETLRKELDEAIPDPNDPPSLEGVLEKLPYLMACVEEGKSTFLTSGRDTDKDSRAPCLWTDDSLAAHLSRSHHIRLIHASCRHAHLTRHLAHASQRDALP